MTTNPDPYLIETTPDPIQISLALDGFLTSLVQEAQAAVQTTLNPPLAPEVIQHLTRMGDLASQLKEEVDQINTLDPTALDRLNQQKSTG